MFTFVFACSSDEEEKHRGLRRDYLKAGRFQGILEEESYKSCRPGRSKLEPMGQFQLATCFCK